MLLIPQYNSSEIQKFSLIPKCSRHLIEHCLNLMLIPTTCISFHTLMAPQVLEGMTLQGNICVGSRLKLLNQYMWVNWESSTCNSENSASRVTLLYLFTYGLLNHAISNSCCIVSNDGLISK
jgi:hypothetical protein